MNAIAESIFGTHNDPDQIPITKASEEKLEQLLPNGITYKLDKHGDPIAWAVVIPTTKEIAELFLRGTLTEKQILDLTTPQNFYSAVYLCASVTVPEHRRQGLATNLMREAIHKIPKTKDCLLFAWPFSKEGKALLQKLQSLGMVVKVRT